MVSKTQNSGVQSVNVPEHKAFEYQAARKIDWQPIAQNDATKFLDASYGKNALERLSKDLNQGMAVRLSDGSAIRRARQSVVQQPTVQPTNNNTQQEKEQTAMSTKTQTTGNTVLLTADKFLSQHHKTIVRRLSEESFNQEFLDNLRSLESMGKNRPSIIAAIEAFYTTDAQRKQAQPEPAKTEPEPVAQTVVSVPTFKLTYDRTWSWVEFDSNLTENFEKDSLRQFIAALPNCRWSKKRTLTNNGNSVYACMDAKVNQSDVETALKNAGITVVQPTVQPTVKNVQTVQPTVQPTVKHNGMTNAETLSAVADILENVAKALRTIAQA